MTCGRRAPGRASYCSAKAKAKKKSRSHSHKKCAPGKITRNPFLNFLRYFRTKHCGWDAIKVAVEGAKCWCSMNDQQRSKFYKEACNAPPFKRRKKEHGGSSCFAPMRKAKKRSRSVRKRANKGKRSCSCSGGKKRKPKKRQQRKSVC